MVEESGFIFTPPGEAWFRFADVPPYRDQLSGRGIKEMDFAYWNAAHGCVVLLEVKDYTGRETPNDLVDDLIGKGRDCLMMLQSAWRGGAAGLGTELAGALPESLRSRARVQLYFVLKVDGSTKVPPLNTMGDKLKWSIRAYASLLDLEGHAVLIDQHRAIKIGLPLRLAPSS